VPCSDFTVIYAVLFASNCNRTSQHYEALPQCSFKQVHTHKQAYTWKYMQKYHSNACAHDVARWTLMCLGSRGGRSSKPVAQLTLSHALPWPLGVKLLGKAFFFRAMPEAERLLIRKQPPRAPSC
ncbi:unnamed protein product, partial [Discosporangium mesarthrocarpum]